MSLQTDEERAYSPPSQREEMERDEEDREIREQARGRWADVPPKVKFAEEEVHIPAPPPLQSRPQQVAPAPYAPAPNYRPPPPQPPPPRPVQPSQSIPPGARIITGKDILILAGVGLAGVAAVVMVYSVMKMFAARKADPEKEAAPPAHKSRRVHRRKLRPRDSESEGSMTSTDASEASSVTSEASEVSEVSEKSEKA